MSSKHRVKVHFFEGRSSIFDRLTRDNLNPVEQFFGARPTMAFNKADNDVSASLTSAFSFTQHREGLSNASCSAKIDAEMTGGLYDIGNVRVSCGGLAYPFISPNLS